ncbi:hypothetical protein L1049_019760 [Liquidambar formosana]|uniref:Disease resistance R13L4/SHOC-2-like LRR domain-containing protein n=1 Tax=Liquidambar formosana TaxID=63359 RepID=A0AAP0S6C1_LIQFO
MKMPQKLKVLDLSFVYGFRRLPNLSINLREPRVSSCTSITELPDSIGNLEKLEQIHIYGCHNLKGEIPWSIGRLFSLRILLLYDTGICSLPTSVFGLSHLQTLHLWRCDELELLPELSHSLTDLVVSSGLKTTFPSLSNLVNLKKLYFSLRNNPIEIPRDIGKLSKLETLIFFESNIINSLPAEIGALSQLKILEVKLCSSIRFILGLPSSLFKLHLYHCYSLERLPDLSNLKNLSTLKLRQCLELKGIQGLEQLESLRYLDVSLCELVERLLDL